MLLFHIDSCNNNNVFGKNSQGEMVFSYPYDFLSLRGMKNLSVLSYQL